MRLPVIVTNATGPAAYLTEDNAYLVSVDEDEDQYGYVQPKISSLVSRMKEVFEDTPERRRDKGVAARETMKGYSPELITSLMVTRLRYHAAMRGWKQV